MAPENLVMGLFKQEDQAVSTIEALKESEYRFLKAHMPFPSHKIMSTLKMGKSRVGYFTLAGGLLGLVCGFALAVYCSVEWRLIVSGKPIISLIPFFIVGFEMTILFAVFGNVIGLLIQTRLPNFSGLTYYDPRCSGDCFGVLADCAAGKREELEDFFRKNGGEVRVFD
jgi:molybdopterin-containing oxidoreductase family membrane subunit